MAGGAGWRVGRTTAFVGLLFLLAAVALLAAVGADGARSRAVVPLGFELAASNGYTVSVYGFDAPPDPGDEPPDPGDEPPDPGDEVYLLVRKPGAVALYLTDDRSVADQRIQATFGDVARVDVRYVPGPGTREARRTCGDRALRFEAGGYEGTIEFHGEGGFADASATSARGTMDFIAEIVCSDGYDEGIGGDARGARLSVGSADRDYEGAENDPMPVAGPEVGMSVIENGGAKRARLEAWMSEDQGSMFVSRGIERKIPAAAFDHAVRRRTARLASPAPSSTPLSGVGLFDGDRPRARRWSGDLTVDLPGRPDLPLTGAGIRAQLVRADYRRAQRVPND